MRTAAVAVGRRATGQAAEISIPDSPVTSWVGNHVLPVRWGVLVVGLIVLALVTSSWLGIILTVVIVLLFQAVLSLLAGQWPFGTRPPERTRSSEFVTEGRRAERLADSWPDPVAITSPGRRPSRLGVECGQNERPRWNEREVNAEAGGRAQPGPVVSTPSGRSRGRLAAERRPRLRPRPLLARAAPLPRAGLHRHHRLHRPRQLGDQHRRRLRVRLHAALGRLAEHAHAHLPAAPLRQARHRHRAFAGRQHPRQAAASLWSGSPGSPSSSPAWPPTWPSTSAPLSASTSSSACRSGSAPPLTVVHRLRRDPRAAVPPAGAHDRRLPRDHRRLLHRRALPREAGLGGGGAGLGHPHGGRRQHPRRARHARRHRDAAQHLPALQRHPVARLGPGSRSPASAA